MIYNLQRFTNFKFINIMIQGHFQYMNDVFQKWEI